MIGEVGEVETKTIIISQREIKKKRE